MIVSPKGPCFLWIFAFAPYLDWIATRPRLQSALSGITAAVVGVIGNLALWFALHVLFGTVTRLDWGPLVLPLPDAMSLDLRALGIMVLSGVALLRLHWSLLWILAFSAALGLLLTSVS